MGEMSFRGAVLTRLGAPLEIIGDIKVPPLRPGQVLVRIAYAGLCRSQIMEVQGKRGKDSYIPHLMGHEGTGTVIATGENVSKVAVGDKIILGWIKGSGQETGGTVYSSPIGSINAGGVTTFNELAVVAENRCVRLPDGIPMDIGVLLGCALPTGAGIVLNQLRPTADSSVGVLGLGGVGLSALIALKLCQPKMIVSIDSEPAKLELARELGATHTILADQHTKQHVLDLTQGVGLDACIEAAGQSASIELGFSLVRRNGGVCIFASHPPSGDMIKIDPYELISGKRIEGSWGGASQPDQDIPRLAALFIDHKLPWRRLLSHSYALDDINQAIDDLAHNRVVRALIHITSADQ